METVKNMSGHSQCLFSDSHTPTGFKYHKVPDLRIASANGEVFFSVPGVPTLLLAWKSWYGWPLS